MAKIRNITKNVKVEVAAAERKCHASSAHKIAAGREHLAVYEAGQRQNICRLCARSILDVAINHLSDIKKELKLDAK